MSAAYLLDRALTAASARAGVPITITSSRAEAWHSATFSGSRHRVEACGTSGERLDRWLAAMGDTDLTLPGHLLADASVGAVERAGGETRFTLAALTVAAD